MERTLKLFSRHGIIILVVVSTLIVYWPVRNHNFLEYDDESYVVKNYYLQPGITGENMLWAMTTGYAANWHPLTWMSHMLDYQLFGLNPAGHHLDSLFLHLLTSVLLYWVFKKMTGSDGLSAFIAIVFALHPLHVESVAWVAERKDTLSGLFAVLSIWAYERYTQSPSGKRYLLLLGLFVLGLLSKPMLVTLPFVLLLLDYWPLQRMTVHPDEHGGKPILELVFEKVPLLLMSIIVSAITMLVQRDAGAVSTLHALPLGTRLSNAAVAYVTYIGKTFWPSNLSVFYPYNEAAIAFPMNLIAFFILVAVTVLCIRQIRIKPYLLVGWLWFLGTLVPVIGIVQVGSQAFADRYTYLPMVGITIMVGPYLADITRSWKWQPALAGFSVPVLALVLVVLSSGQVRYWKDSETLFRHALNITERNWLAHYTLGVVFERQGYLQGAQMHFERAAELEPRQAIPQYRFGDILQQQGEYERSIPHLIAALQREPKMDKAHVLLAVALAKMGKTDEALEHFRTAYSSNHFFGEPHQNMALVLAGDGKYEEALRYFRLAEQAVPGDSVIRSDIGRVLELQRAEAKKQKRK